METHFATPERATSEELERQVMSVTHNPLIDAVLCASGGMVAVLNEYRQIVTINECFLDALGIADPRQVLGFRPGEAIDCIHANAEEGGCGTARPCATCGAAIAIVSSLSTGQPVERKCVARVHHDAREEDLYLSVRSVMLSEELEPFVLLFLQDITTEQNRAALDRVFFHDIVNILSGLVSATSLVEDEGYMDDQVQRIIVNQVKHLHKEVEMQRTISHHGADGIKPEILPVLLETIRIDCERTFAKHKATRGKSLEFSGDPGLESVDTDRFVLLRVLANMLVNAAEDTRDGGVVRVHMEVEDECLLISVWNDAYIPEKVRPRIFQRNFSTKRAEGRGLGTYSMKFFAERHLGAKVSFTSSKEAGTTFTVSLPL